MYHSYLLNFSWEQKHPVQLKFLFHQLINKRNDDFNLINENCFYIISIVIRKTNRFFSDEREIAGCDNYGSYFYISICTGPVHCTTTQEREACSCSQQLASLAAHCRLYCRSLQGYILTWLLSSLISSDSTQTSRSCNVWEEKSFYFPFTSELNFLLLASVAS